MHPVIIGVLFVAALVVGYVFRGWIAGELVASKAELSVFATRLESAIAQDEKTAKTFVANIIADIRKKL